MRSNVKVNITPLGVVAFGGLAALVYAWTQRDKIIKAAEEAAALVNPNDSRNMAYGSANAVVRTVTGDPTATLGSWLYDVKSRLFPSEADKAIAALLQPSINPRILDPRDAQAGLNGPAAQALSFERTVALLSLGLGALTYLENRRARRGR